MRVPGLKTAFLFLLAFAFLPLKLQGAFNVQVLSEAGEPLPAALLELEQDSVKRKLSLDSQGTVDATIINQAKHIRLTASAQGHAPMYMEWPAEKIPVEFAFRLPEAQTISGKVQDLKGNPVPGAKVTIIVPQRLAGPFVATDFPPVVTGSDGTWRCETVPKNPGFINLEVSHPEYAAMPENISLKSILSGQSALRMQAVALVHGAVKDASGHPLAGASVYLGAGNDLWPGSQLRESVTDTNGQFRFEKTPHNEHTLGVYHSKFAPLLKRVSVSGDTPSLEISLEPGRLQRLRVVNKSGQPLDRAVCTVDEWPSGGSSQPSAAWHYPGWQFTSDASGRALWSNAPPHSVTWSISKGGYMTRAGYSISTSAEEHTVTLLDPFKVTGHVKDKDGKPIPQFWISSRFVQVHATHKQPGLWVEYERKEFSNGQFTRTFERPLLHGAREMHHWQFRAEADGYQPALSGILDHEESGAHLNFVLQSAPLPEIKLPVPAAGEKIAAAAAVAPEKVEPGDSATVYFKVRIAPGHHIYALEESGGASIPTDFKITLPQEFTASDPWRAPAPLPKDDNLIYKGEIIFSRRMSTSGWMRPGKFKIPIKLTFQICNEALCWPPESLTREIELEVARKPLNQ